MEPNDQEALKHGNKFWRWFSGWTLMFWGYFLAHQMGAYAIPVALSGVRRLSSVVCRLCPP